MIRINDRFSIDRDNYGWNLYEYYIGTDKETGEPKEMTTKTFPGKLWVALSRIVDKCGSEAADVAELAETIARTVEEFKTATKSIR